MLPQFYNRKRELDYLSNIYKKNGFKLVVLYGRRRVGKTELLKEFLKGKEGAYILLTDESIEENIKEFKNKFYELINKEYFLKIETDSLYELFKFFINEVKDKKLVLVIDELPYMLNLNKGFLSLFQKIIDELLKNTSIFVIFCGSSLSIMENDVLGYKSALYGRDINSWKLLPFDFKTVCELSQGVENSMLKYFVFGNIPYYLKFYDDGNSLFDNIKVNLLSKGMNLYDEPLILLRQEFRESRTYRLILKYISLGYKSIGKLCSATGLDKSNIMKYLFTLEETNIVRHILPFGLKRKGIYEIIDPLFKFWFKFAYPNRDKLEIGNIAEVEAIINNEINSYFGISFEYLIEELLRNSIFEELSSFSDIHKWWYKDQEIDIVALNEQKKEILFGECKWKEKVNANSVLAELSGKAGYVDWHNEDRKESYAVFAKSFSKRIKEFEGKKVYCFDLRDIERALKRH